MMRKYLCFTLALLLAFGFPIGARAATLYDDGEIVISDTAIYPKTDGGSTVGKSGNEFSNAYFDSLVVGGVAYTSFAAGTDGNWTDNGATVTLDGNPTGIIATKSSGDFASTGFTVGTGDLTFAQGGKVDGDTNGTMKLIEASDTLSFIFSGTTIQLDSSDGGFQFGMTSATEGQVDFLTNNDTDDYLSITTSSNVPTIITTGTSNLTITPDGGTTTVTGALTATGLATAAGLTTSTTITLQNSETIVNSTNNTVEVGGGTGTVLSVLDAGTADSDATLLLRADASADNGDDWQAVSDGATNGLLLQNDTSGTQATKLTLSTAGVLTLTGALTLSNAETISNATDTIVRIASSGTTDSITEIYATGTSDGDSSLMLTADADADAGDRMAIVHDGATNSMLFQSDTASADTLATILTLAKTGLITTTGDVTVAGTTPVVTIGDGGAEDNTLYFDGQTTKNWSVGTDATDDTFVVAFSDTFGTDNRLAIDDDANNTKIVLGDGASYDHYVIFDGASTADYYMGYDHTGGASSTCLTIGAGSAVGTTAALNIDTSANVTITNDVTFRTSLLALGRISASSSLASSATSIGTSSVAYGYVRKFLGAGAEAMTLPNGIPGQVLNITVVVSAGGVMTVTPSQSQLINSFTMTAADDSITLLYLNDTLGWIVLGAEGSTAINYYTYNPA